MSYIYIYVYLLTYLLTPWTRVLLEKLTDFAANQEIPHILWNPKVHHRTHKRPPPVPILSQLHPVPTIPSHFLKIHLYIILPSTSWSPQWSLLHTSQKKFTICPNRMNRLVFIIEVELVLCDVGTQLLHVN